MSNEQKFADFDEIKFFWIIEGDLVNKTPLRIAAGKTETIVSAMVDIPVIRINGKPYIPGSSLKGVFRSTCEVLARSMGKKVCNIFSQDEKEKDDPCIVCQIFGNHFLQSHVRVYDAYAKNNVRVRIKPGISINRITDSVNPGALFEEEIVEPGAKFSFRMQIINIDLEDKNDERSKLLRSLLKMLTEFGIQVGGRKSVGYGWVILENARAIKWSFKNGKLTKEKEIPLKDVLGE